MTTDRINEPEVPLTERQLKRLREAKAVTRAKIAELRAKRAPSTKVKTVFTGEDLEAFAEIERLASESMGPALEPGVYEVTFDDSVWGAR